MIVVVLAITWFAIGRNQVERFRFYDFDKGEWSKATPSERYFMAKYLVDEGVLIGKSKDGVLSLLGEASSGSTNMPLYNLGSERGSLFVIDDDWLEITFEGRPDQRVVGNARIRPD